MWPRLLKQSRVWIAGVSLLASYFIVNPLVNSLQAQTAILGELEFQAASKVEKTSGVWIDGQYVGYLGELKGKKKVLLLPGDH
jgi:hypothetical protein